MSEDSKKQALKQFTFGDKTYGYYNINSLKEKGYQIDKLPITIKILLEGAIRQLDHNRIKEEHIHSLAGWQKNTEEKLEVPFMPSRVLLQDFTGVPAMVDLASMGQAVGGALNPGVKVDLVVDHSVQVDSYGKDSALSENIELEYERNKERYEFLKWAQNTFQNFRVVPPGMGIIHQVNLEYLASVVEAREEEGLTILYPDTLVGTDSHTTMINGLGVLGWGVGGIEAEANMLGEPSYMTMPNVIGVRLTGALKEGATATDLALSVTALLRSIGVVGQFVEFFGEGLKSLTLADRATVANMAPEYGATCGYFPFDEESYNYLLLTGRKQEEADRVREYFKINGLMLEEGVKPEYTKEITLDLSTVTASLAGPKRPQDLMPLNKVKEYFKSCLTEAPGNKGYGLSIEELDKKVKLSVLRPALSVKQEEKLTKKETVELKTGDIVLAAITSCTNTSNPYVMLGAGLMAKKAVELGLKVPAFVKTSLAPGSLIVSDYLDKALLTPYLKELGFHTVGYGCTTCIGNSGKLLPEIEKAISEENLLTASVLSGNRNFEGRIHPLIKANFLASPMLVIAYALAGTILIDFENDPIGENAEGQKVYLKDIWPTSTEIQSLMDKSLKGEMFLKRYEKVWLGNEKWEELKARGKATFDFKEDSTYIRNPPYFDNMSEERNEISNLKKLRVLAKFGDSVTTDHISPAGNIGKNTPAGKYLAELGVEVKDFNTYGSRRGNHEVMMRGTFANIRIRNRLAEGKEGGYTKHFTSGEIVSIYDAAMKYKAEGKTLLIIAGKDYGMGSSRDWAAKGTALLGVKAVLAESYERIHRSNLVMMGVLPFEFLPGDTAESLGLTGEEQYTFLIEEKEDNLVTVNTEKLSFKVCLRIDSAAEWDYYRNGGILQMIARRKLEG